MTRVGFGNEKLTIINTKQNDQKLRLKPQNYYQMRVCDIKNCDSYIRYFSVEELK